MKKIETTSELMEVVNGFRLSRIILTAVELRIFDTLDGKSCSSANTASLINADKRATDRLMNVLAGAGLLDKQHGLFCNSAFAARHLVSSSPAFLGGLPHTADLWRRWDTLTQVIKKGSAIDIEDNFNDRNSDWFEMFIAAMHARGVAQGKEFAGLIDLTNIKRSLDIGGGSGAFTFGLIEKRPSIKGVIFDLPSVVPITQKYIDRYNLGSNVAIMSGDYLSDNFGQAFDLVLMFAIIHINSPDENKLIIKKGVEALSTGGTLVIMDHLLNDDRTEPFIGAMFAINMLVGTRKGDAYTLDEIRGWMQEAGLADIKTISPSSGNQYITGIKP
ncbi:MAG: methyltransferase [Bacteroidota bacterium]